MCLYLHVRDMAIISLVAECSVGVVVCAGSVYSVKHSSVRSSQSLLTHSFIKWLKNQFLLQQVHSSNERERERVHCTCQSG